MGRKDRIRRRLLRSAVEENLDTIRGLAPASLRRQRRILATITRRSTMMLVPLLLAASSFVVSSGNGSPRAGWPDLKLAGLQPPSIPHGKPTPPPPTFAAPQPIDPSVFDLEVRRVILDAGHGGSDPGTTSGNLLEKTITLDIEQRLRRLLEAASYEVHETRNGDQMIPLKRRADVANRAAGDVFVSIHVNSIANPQNHGVETYYLGATSDPRLVRLAASENHASGYSMNDMRRLLERVYTDARGEESRQLADSVQSALYTNLRSHNRLLENWGVRRAPFVVLIATEMPAILAEVSCLSSPQEADLLRDPKYRQEIARALFLGIDRYSKSRTLPGAEKGS